MKTNSKLITIYTPKDRTEYFVISGLLDSAGIKYLSLNEGVQNLFGAGEIGGFNILTGGIKIQVTEEDAEEAINIIKAEPQLTNPLWFTG